MDTTPSLSPKSFWQRDSFHFIKAEECEGLGIDAADIPLGTFPALKHPSHLPSKFGGNAYGFGFFEVHDRLDPEDIKLLQSITFDNVDDIRSNYQKLNEIYARIGLLIRFSSFGKPYYLIPVQLASHTLTHTKSKVDEIAKIVGFHRKKYFKENYDIGLVTHQDDLISRELSYRFKEHRFVTIDSFDKMQGLNQNLDLVILTTDLYDIILLEKFSPFSQEMPSKRNAEQYVVYTLWKLYNALKSDGEIFVISNAYTPKTNQTAEIVFKSEQEEKKFGVFTHIFKTKKKYKLKGRPLQINIFDFQKYLSSLYIEQEEIDALLGGRRLEDLSLEDINLLPYRNVALTDQFFLKDQEKSWSKLLSIHFDQIFLKPLVPPSLTEDWKGQFSSTDFVPQYMMIYLGQKKPLETTLPELMRDVEESRLLGSSLDHLAPYRNTFAYVIQTLRVLERLKNGTYSGLPEIFIDRLRQPLINRHRKFRALNDVLKLISKIKRLETVRDYLNPDHTEGPKTSVLDNLEALTFFGFKKNELKEILYIIFGHTVFGRIIAGKMSEKAFQPVLDLAQTYDTQQALNLLRFCRLMNMAETEAARGSDLPLEQFAELFDFYELAVRVVSNRDLNWYEVLDEKIASMGGIHNKVIRKVFKMMNYYEFINNWSELGTKGPMEKEALADYESRKLDKIENVIRLINTVEQFEKSYLKSDPLELPAFYRKILDKEFHGTGYIFKKMDGFLVFVLLSITANLSRGEIINFNPLLADVRSSEIDDRIRRIEEEAKGINMQYITFDVLRQFSEELHRHGSSFVLGTGFRIKVDKETQALEMAYLDVDDAIDQLDILSKEISGRHVPEIPVGKRKHLERIFSDLESFYQSHLRFIDATESAVKIPAIQKQWFQKAQGLRQYLRTNFLAVFFHPESIYTSLNTLYRQAPTVLDFILPEFIALQEKEVSWHLYMTSPVTRYIIAATRKLQALIIHDKEQFQDRRFLHWLAQREFGPMATGTVGVSDSQIEDLEQIVDNLSKNQPLLDALIKSLIFQDMGRLPELREKYKREINPAELAQASAIFIEKEGISKTYSLDKKGKSYLIFLVKHHSLIHHILRGEFQSSALNDVLYSQDRDLFDAFFIFSFIMLSSIRDDLILEDLAGQLFKTKAFCDSILDGKTSFNERLDRIFMLRGDLVYALIEYQTTGLPEGISPSHYLKSEAWKKPEKAECLRAGKMAFALERIFKLCGIRYVQYMDLVKLMIKIPLKYIYKEHKLSSIGYAAFEKEIFEAFRIYNNLKALSEKTRNFILKQLADDTVRIFGYEKVSGYLSYENQIKLLLIGLLGTKDFDPNGPPVSLNFLVLCEKIERRYEAINDNLNAYSADELMEKNLELDHYFSAETGLILKKEIFPNGCTIDFQDSINISQKLPYMAATNDVEQLRHYFHTSLLSIRRYPFFTDDYEEKLEEAFKTRFNEITDMILNQTKKQMDLIHDFKEVYNLVNDLLDRSLEIGFSSDQKHRLNDLYELRKDSLKREKLSEIDSVLESICDTQELKDYWDSIKWYLQNHRKFFGKEFERIIAKKFDEAGRRIGM